MITPEEMTKQLGRFSEEESRSFDTIIEQLTTVSKEKTISEETLKRLEVAERELSMIKRNYAWRIIKLLKLGNKLV